MGQRSKKLSEYLLRDDKAEIVMPSAEGHVGYPRDLIDLDDGALTQLAGLKLAVDNGNGHRKRPSVPAVDESSEDG